MLEVVDPDLEWTYLDPKLERPETQAATAATSWKACRRQRQAAGCDHEAPATNAARPTCLWAVGHSDTSSPPHDGQTGHRVAAGLEQLRTGERELTLRRGNDQSHGRLSPSAHRARR